MMNYILFFICNFFCTLSYATQEIYHKDLEKITQTELSDYIRKISNVLNEVENQKLKIPKSFSGNWCTQAGWFFVGRTSCESRIPRQSCMNRQVKCAIWTGTRDCVSKENPPLHICLQKNLKENLGEYFRYPVASGDWTILTKYAKLVCSKNTNHSCREMNAKSTKLVSKIKNRKVPLVSKESNIYVKPRKNAKFNFELNSFLFAKAFAEDTCSYDIKNKFFVKKDGSKIYFLFSKHQKPGDGGNGFIWNFINNNPNASKTDLESFLQGKIDSNKELMARFDRDRDEIAGRFSRNEITWVAWEGMPSDFSMEQFAQWREQNIELRYELQSRGVSTELLQRVFEYSYGPIVDDYLAEKTWTRGEKPIYGFDSSFIKMWNTQFEAAEEIRNEFWFNPDFTPKHATILVEFADRIENADINEIPNQSEFNEVLDKFPSTMREKIMTYLLKIKQAREVSFARDNLGAYNLLQKSGNGLVIMGSAHETNLLRELTSQCLVQSKVHPVINSDKIAQ